jgi:hypothetical protein
VQKIITLLIVLSISAAAIGQDNLSQVSDSIVAEGRLLYKSEMASWHGTDIFLEKYKNTDKIGGYLSYMENNLAKCIFFSKAESVMVIGTIVFDTSYNINTAQTDLNERTLTEPEKELYTMRAIALKTVNNDSLFKTYSKTSLNLIPLISNGEKKVYVLTAPQENGIVIFGNDYLLRFNSDNELAEKKQLHHNIISINYGNTGDTTVVGTIHTHTPGTGDFITATDVCTLMLYEKAAKWEQHYVIAKNYISIWDCNKNLLAILTKKAWDNINSDQKKRRKN